MRHREARLDKRNVTYVGIYTSVKLIVREVLEVFCGFYFYRRVEFFTSPDSVFDNFNDRRTLMDRHRGERFADVNMMDSNRHSGCSVIRFGLVLQLMGTLNYTSSTEL